MAENRHHDAHVHGAASINVALEGKNLYIELISPAANIVGFEHHPRTQEQKSAVKKAIETLKAGEKLFALPPEAGGKLVKSMVQTDIEGDSGHKSEDEHLHKEVKNGKEDHGSKHRHQDHREGDEHERHSEFKAEYHFICSKPEKLAHIDIMLFRSFPGIEHIEVQLLTDTQQTALELTGKMNKIKF